MVSSEKEMDISSFNKKSYNDNSKIESAEKNNKKGKKKSCNSVTVTWLFAVKKGERTN